MEEATYFSKQSLSNLLALISYQARAHIAASASLPERLLLISQYVDDADVFEPYIEIGGNPAGAFSALLKPKDLATLKLNSASWERMQALQSVPSIHGAIQDKKGTVLFLGENAIGAVEIAKSGNLAVLSKSEAKHRLESFCASEIRSRSQSGMRLMGVFPSSEGATLRTADGSTIQLTRAEYEEVMQGHRLPPQHPLSTHMQSKGTIVMYSNPLMMKEGEALRESDTVAFNLQRAYPEARIMRDPLSKNTAEQVKKIDRFAIAKPSDLLVIVPDAAKPIPRGKAIANIVPDLKKAGANVTVFTGKEKASGNGGKAVFVITGHISSELAEFVRSVGGAGFFRNNYVIFNSCEAPLTGQLIAEINERYGAIATFSFQGNIQPSNVQEYLLDVVHNLDGKKKVDLIGYLRDAVLKQNLVGTFTICQEMPVPVANHD